MDPVWFWILIIVLGVAAYLVIGTLNLWMRKEMELGPGPMEAQVIHIVGHFWGWPVTIGWVLPAYIAFRLGIDPFPTNW